jgi:hypothetical protein
MYASLFSPHNGWCDYIFKFLFSPMLLCCVFLSSFVYAFICFHLGLCFFVTGLSELSRRHVHKIRIELAQGTTQVRISCDFGDEALVALREGLFNAWIIKFAMYNDNYIIIVNFIQQ